SVYGRNETTLEAAVISELIEAGKTVAVAESLTGGELGGRFTSVSGSSEAFRGGIVAYADSIKVDVLGVRAETIT
ncbi:CinA family protein, partial [Pseudomonas aeruginosa]